MAIARIIDAHMHLWDLSLQKHDWLTGDIETSFLGNYQPICQTYGVEQYQKDTQHWQVEQAVHVQAGWQADDAVGETRWLQQLEQEKGLPNGIVGYADLAAEGVENLLREHRQAADLRGIRQIINWHPKSYYSGCGANHLENPAWQKGYAELARHDLSFDCQVYPQQMDTFYAIATRYDNVPIAIEHCGMPLCQDRQDKNYWRAQLKRAAQLPQAVLKLSGLGMFFHRWQFEDVQDIINTCFETFGVGRCLFGSNFPVEGLYSDFDNLMRIMGQLTQGFSATESEQFFYHNAQQFYRLQEQDK